MPTYSGRDDDDESSRTPGGAAVKYYLASTRCTRCYSVQPVHWSEAAVRAARSLPPGAVFANLPCRRTRCIDPQTGRRTIVEVVTEDFAKVTPVLGGPRSQLRDTAT